MEEYLSLIHILMCIRDRTGTVSAGCTSGDIPGTGKTVVPFYQQSAGGGL